MSYRYTYAKVFRTFSMWSMIGIILAGLLGMAFTVSPSQPADVTPPAVPVDIQVPEGQVAYMVGHASGTQNYTCTVSNGAIKWVLFTPQATLFNESGEELMTHYFGPNPDEAGIVRAAWQDSRDTSIVWGRVMPGDSSVDSNYVAPGAIPWLLVTIVGQEDGPLGGDRLSQTKFIQRVNTSGGAAPSTGCAASEDLGKQAFVPYTTDYYFFRATKNNGK